MRTDEIIQNLKYTAKKHENDKVFTGQLNISSMCKDILPKMEQLKAYEDAEEQGLLLRLPCKVGTKVYYISPHNTISLEKGVLYEGVVTRVYAMEEETCVTIKIHTDYGVTELSNITDFGKTVFLTKKAAEQKLAELKGESNG